MRDLDLIRLEHKIDMILNALQVKGLMHKSLPSLSGIEEDACPVCRKKVSLMVDTTEGVVLRNCGCKLPVKAFKLTLIKNEEAKNANNGPKESAVPSDDEK